VFATLFSDWYKERLGKLSALRQVILCLLPCLVIGTSFKCHMRISLMRDK